MRAVSGVDVSPVDRDATARGLAIVRAPRKNDPGSDAANQGNSGSGDEPGPALSLVGVSFVGAVPVASPPKHMTTISRVGAFEAGTEENTALPRVRRRLASIVLG